MIFAFFPQTPQDFSNHKVKKLQQKAQRFRMLPVRSRGYGTLCLLLFSDTNLLNRRGINPPFPPTAVTFFVALLLPKHSFQSLLALCEKG
jgi:hypothetical protein